MYRPRFEDCPERKMWSKWRPAFSSEQARPGKNSSLTGQGLLGKMPQAFDEFIHGEFIIEFPLQTAISG